MVHPPCAPGRVWHDGATAYTDIMVSSSFRAHAMPIHHMFKAFASARWNVMQDGWLGLAEAHRCGCRFYVVTQSLRVSKALAQAPQEIVTPGAVLRCSVQLTKVGNTSFTMNSTMTLIPMNRTGVPQVSSSSLTATINLVYVFVDPKTSKKVPVPPELKPKLVAAVAQDAEPAPAGGSAGAPTGEVYTHTARLRHSDTDFNGHINQSVTTQLLADAVEEQRGMEPLFEHVSVQYAKEMHAGDSVRVELWQVGAAIHFRVVGESGDVHTSGRATLHTDASL